MEHTTIFLDVETTGIGSFRPPKQRIMQLSWIYNDNEFNFFIDDVTKVSPSVPHDITIEYCHKHGVSFSHAFSILLRHLQDCDKLVCHNVDFDISSIAFELKIRKHKEYSTYKRIIKDLISSNDLICTMKSTVDLCKLPLSKNAFKFPKLSELYFHLFGKQPHLELHDSLNDCILLRQCYSKLYVYAS